MAETLSSMLKMLGEVTLGDPNVHRVNRARKKDKETVNGKNH